MSFRQYLTEVRRTEKRALKLLDYIEKRWSKPSLFRSDNIKLKSKMDDGQYTLRDIRPVGEGEMPTNKLIPSQSTVSAADVRRHIRDRHKQKPIDVLLHKGSAHIDDGHHRWFANRLLGEPVVKTRKFSTGK